MEELQEFPRNKVSQLDQHDIDVEAMQAGGKNLGDPIVSA